MGLLLSEVETGNNNECSAVSTARWELNIIYLQQYRHIFIRAEDCFQKKPFYMTDIDSCVEKCIRTPDVRSVAPYVMCVSSQLGVCVSCYKHRGQLATNTWSSHGELFPRWWLSLYLLSQALGKSAPVWRDPLCADCAFLCLICVEVAVDLTGPLLQRSRDLVLGFLQPSQQGLTWKCSQDVLFSKRPSLSLSLFLPLSLYLSEVFHWYSSIFMLNWASLTVEGFPRARHPQLNLSRKESNMYVIWLTADLVSFCTT